MTEQEVILIIENYLSENLQRTKVSQLPDAATLDGLKVLGVSNSQSVKVAMELLKGNKGDSVELQVSSTHIQWRISGGSWANLIALSELKVKGDDGQPVEFNKSATHLQWRLVGTSSWTNLIPLSELQIKGDTGDNIELRVNATHVQWRVENTTTWYNLIPLADLKGGKGDDAKQVEFNKSSTHLQWRLVGDILWTDLVPLVDLKGGKGDNIEIQKTSTHIQWRVVGDANWTDLMPLDDLKVKGDTGENIELQKSATHIQWRVKDDVLWENLVPLADLKGEPGDGSGNVLVTNPTDGVAGKVYALKPSADASVMYTIEEIDFSDFATKEELGDKVDKVSNKGLSTNDYTNDDKTKVDAIPVNPKYTDTVTSVNGKTGAIAKEDITALGIPAQDTTYELATALANGLMSKGDKAVVDFLAIMLDENDPDFIDTLAEILDVFATYPEGIDIMTKFAEKVDKVEGKGLSANDFTTTLKDKLDGIAKGAQKNSAITKSEIEAKLTGNITSHTHSAYIEANKFQVVASLPANPDPNVFYFVKE